jgi:regulatory protein
MPTVTRLERQKKNPERVNVYLDDEFAFGLNEMEAVQLRKGQVLSDADVAALKSSDTLHKAVEQGIGLLSYRPRSTHEVRTALAKKHDPNVIDGAIERLVTMGYLDDVGFARFWIENRSAFKPLSSRALRFELREKGVPDDIINTLLADVTDEEAALKAAQSQLRKHRGKPRQHFREQMSNFLQRRGFSYGVANSVIKQLQETLLEEDPDYFAEE